MNRQQYTDKATRLRKGLSTALIETDKHGRRFTASRQEHDSLNAAKRANGAGAVALQRGETFPPSRRDLPPIEETSAPEVGGVTSGKSEENRVPSGVEPISQNPLDNFECRLI